MPRDRFGEVVQWFMTHAPNISVYVHPNSGCEVYDHRDWAFFTQAKPVLNLTCLHYDCPGCNINDCRARSNDAVMSNTAGQCGLVQRTVHNKPIFNVQDSKKFCSPPCQSWITATLPRWAQECPYNCDLFKSNEQQYNTCQAHINSLSHLQDQSKAICS